MDINLGLSAPVLVTGSAGFIGSHLVDELLSRGRRVVGVDVKECAREGKGFTHVVGDVRNEDLIDDTLARYAPDAVVHLAAETRLLRRADIDDYSSNTKGLETILRSIEARGGVDRLVFASTQLVCRLGYVPESATDFKPTTLYGWTKAYGELAVRAFDGAGTAWTIVRPTTVWGPGMSQHYRRFLWLLRAGLYWHFSHDTATRSLGYVKNIAYQLGSLLEASKSRVNRTVCYLADYEPVSLESWIDRLAQGLGRETVHRAPRWSVRTLARVGDFMQLCGFSSCPLTSARIENIETSQTVDTSIIESIAGSCPWSLEQGIEETVEWFLRDPDRLALQ